MSKKKSPDEIAREQVAAEEAERREERIAEIVAAEEAKQEAERREQEAVEGRKKAAAEATELAEKRKPLEDALAAKIAEIAPVADELADLHDRHSRALYRSLDPEYRNRQHAGYEGLAFTPTPDWARSNHDVRETVRGYLEGSLPTLYPKATAPKGALSEVDPLTPSDGDDPAGRPVGDFPWEQLEEASHELAEKRAADEEKRRASDAARKLRDLEERHRRVRANYGRPVGFNELVVPEERTRLRELCTEEEIEAFKANIEEQSGGRRAAVSPDMVSGSGGAA